MAYAAANVDIPERAPEDLVQTGELVEVPGTGFVVDDPYHRVAPGLYPDETVVALDPEGELVAVSVTAKRAVNGAGMELTAWARWIESDGRTKLDPHGADVESSFTWAAAPDLLTTYALGPLSKEMLLAVLGEPAELTEEITVEALPAEHPADTTVAEPGTQVQLPVLGLSADARTNVSVREAIKTAQQAGQLNAGSALGL